MSESNGSTILSSAGLAKSGSAVGHPIIRGVLMAASCVLPALSGNFTPNASTSSLYAMNDSGVGASGFDAGCNGGYYVGTVTTGSYSYNFTMLLNGHINSEQYPNTITASLNPAKENYIANVLNTDPAKLQEAGHVLYSHYDIYPSQAIIDSSGIALGYQSGWCCWWAVAVA